MCRKLLYILQLILFTSLLRARHFGCEKSLWHHFSEQLELTDWALIYKTENRTVWKPGHNLWKSPKALVEFTVAPVIKFVDKNTNILQFRLCHYKIPFTWLVWFLQLFNFYSSSSISHCMSCVYPSRLLYILFEES